MVGIYIISSRPNTNPKNIISKNIILHSITLYSNCLVLVNKIIKTRSKIKDHLPISHEIQVIWFIYASSLLKIWETLSFWREGRSELIRLNLLKWDDFLVLTLALLLQLFLLYCTGPLHLRLSAWLTQLPWGWQYWNW